MVASKNREAIGRQKTIKGPAQPASLRGKQRKAKILAAATDLFLSNGYGDTSIHTIVRRSGGSKATLYSYYPTKAELFRSVVDSIVINQKDPDLQSLDDIRATLETFAEHRLSVVFSAKHRALVRLIIAEREHFRDIARLYYEQGPLRSHTILHNYFEYLIDKNRIEIESANEAAEFFCGMLMHQRYIEQLYLDECPLSKEEIVFKARHVVDRFLAAYHVLE